MSYSVHIILDELRSVPVLTVSKCVFELMLSFVRLLEEDTSDTRATLASADRLVGVPAVEPPPSASGRLRRFEILGELR